MRYTKPWSHFWDFGMSCGRRTDFSLMRGNFPNLKAFSMERGGDFHEKLKSFAICLKERRNSTASSDEAGAFNWKIQRAFLHASASLRQIMTFYEWIHGVRW